MLVYVSLADAVTGKFLGVTATRAPSEKEAQGEAVARLFHQTGFDGLVQALSVPIPQGAPVHPDLLSGRILSREQVEAIGPVVHLELD